MKILKSIVILIFVAVLIFPIVFFNFNEDAISEIDNRKLAKNPFSEEGDLTKNLENYVNDRIGLRDEIITGYTIINDKLFGIMEHPSYTYGKDDFVFGAGITVKDNFSDFHIAFAEMVKKIQNYCLERGTPFVFVFNPAKPAVYQEKIASGIKYNRTWVNKFFLELDKRGVSYVDNTKTLIDIKTKGINGFNVKYDANHWNDVGAFYGTNEMLKALKPAINNVHVNTIEEFNVTYEHKDTLLVSNFPINENVPLYQAKVNAYNIGGNYANLKLDSQYRSFGYYVNDVRKEEGAPRSLVFQGSYVNSYGYKFLANAFGEYIHVHDYQNVINFPYYYNVFKPDCVIFEVAEYTFIETYFDFQKMLNIDYNPNFSSSNCLQLDVNNENLVIKQQDDTLTTLEFITSVPYRYAWIELDSVYDMQKSERGYEVTVKTEVINNKMNAKVYVSNQ